MLNIMNDNEVYYSIEEVALRLKVVYLTVYRWIRSGKLKSVKAGKQYRISNAELTKYLTRNNESK
jgi:excisionase family DNA binding protein